MFLPSVHNPAIVPARRGTGMVPRYYDELTQIIGRHVETALHYSQLLATISRQRG